MFLNWLLSQLDKLLSLLPLNGDKMKLGLFTTLLSLMHMFFPAFDILAWADARMIVLGLPLVLVGLVHKAIKEFLAAHEPTMLTNSSAKTVAVVNKEKLKDGEK